MKRFYCFFSLINKLARITTPKDSFQIVLSVSLLTPILNTAPQIMILVVQACNTRKKVCSFHRSKAHDENDIDVENPDKKGCHYKCAKIQRWRVFTASANRFILFIPKHR